MKPEVGRNFTSERGEGVKGEVNNISLHWLQGIFETVPYNEVQALLTGKSRKIGNRSRTHPLPRSNRKHGMFMFLVYWEKAAIRMTVLSMTDPSR